jgi:hypothetical protein
MKLIHRLAIVLPCLLAVVTNIDDMDGLNRDVSRETLTSQMRMGFVRPALAEYTFSRSV